MRQVHRSDSRLIVVAALFCSLAGPLQAAELKIFGAGASKAALESVLPAYERASGDTVRVSYDTVGALRERVEKGEPVDLVVLSAPAIAQLGGRGLLGPGHPLTLGVVVAGLAVRQGAPLPDISTEAALRQTLMAAKSLSHADGARGATSGAHFAKVIDALGLRETLAPRLTVLPFGVDVIQGVSDGRFELGVSQSSEIVPVAGVRFVGALPEPYGLKTSYQAATVGTGGAGQALQRFLAEPAQRERFKAAGFVTE
jgi:molybdate transport system substrate-binding protein